MRRQIGELRTTRWIRMRANHDRYRWRIQVEQRVDATRTRNNRHRRAGLEQMRFLQLQIPNAKVRSDRIRILELKYRMQTRTLHHMKSSRERVLVNIRRSFHPKQNLNVKARRVVNDQFWLTEPRRGLHGLRILQEKLAHQFGQVDVVCRRSLNERGRCNLRKSFGRKVQLLPTIIDHAAQFRKIGIHIFRLAHPR